MSSIILTNNFKTITTIFYFITYSIKSLHSISYQSQLRCFVLLQNSIREKRFHPSIGNKLKISFCFYEIAVNSEILFIFSLASILILFVFVQLYQRSKIIILRHSKKYVFTWQGLTMQKFFYIPSHFLCID